MVSFYVGPPVDHGMGTSKKSRRDRNRRKDLFEKQEGKCFWCTLIMDMNPLRQTESGRWKENQAFASFEHLIPKSHGGSNRASNIVLAHLACNNKRHIRRWPHDPVYGEAAGKTAMQSAFERAKGAQCQD